MITPADPYLEAFAKAGCDGITVHAEAGPHLDRSLQASARSASVPASRSTRRRRKACSVSPRQDRPRPRHDREPRLRRPEVHHRDGEIRRVRAMIGGDRPIELEVDGGIAIGTFPAAAGTNTFVAGSAIFGGGHVDAYRKTIDTLRSKAEESARVTMFRKTAVALLASLAAASAWAGDFSTFQSLGFSPDGKVYAFEEFGIQDGSGFPYSNVYFIDTERTPIFLVRRSAYASTTKRPASPRRARKAATRRRRSATNTTFWPIPTCSAPSSSMGEDGIDLASNISSTPSSRRWAIPMRSPWKTSPST